MTSRFQVAIERAVSPILVLCALATTGLAAHRELARPKTVAPRAAGRVIGRPPLARVTLPPGQVLGEPSAVTRIIEFADFQCPFCAEAAKTLAQLRAKHPAKFAIEFHHLPIPGHAFARMAAEAAECAAEQGRFERFFYLTFEEQRKLGSSRWRELASRAGVRDLSTFERCFDEHRFSSKIDADLRVAAALGIRGTPTWIVNDSLFGGLPPPDQLEAWVTRETSKHASVGRE